MLVSSRLATLNFWNRVGFEYCRDKTIRLGRDRLDSDELICYYALILLNFMIGFANSIDVLFRSNVLFGVIMIIGVNDR